MIHVIALGSAWQLMVKFRLVRSGDLFAAGTGSLGQDRGGERAGPHRRAHASRLPRPRNRVAVTAVSLWLLRRGWVLVVVAAIALAGTAGWAARLSAQSVPVTAQAAPKPATRDLSPEEQAPTDTKPGPERPLGPATEARETGGEGASPGTASHRPPVMDGAVLVPNPKSQPVDVDKQPTQDAEAMESTTYRAPQLLPPTVPGFTSDLPGGDQSPSSPGGIAASTGSAAVRALITRYFPADQVDNAVRVSMCESGQQNVTSKPNSNGTRDHGIFQLNDGGTLDELLDELGARPDQEYLALDPEWNVRAAAHLQQTRGWHRWTCARQLGIA